MNDTPPPAAAPSSAPVARLGPPIALIAAVARNGVIGIDNRLPWRLPDDLRRFRVLTIGHPVIMGRRTWESIGGPLPGRQNIVVSRQPAYRASGAPVAGSLADALALVALPGPTFVIGGEALYRAALPLADMLYLTEIERDFDGDARFPEFAREAWRLTSRELRQGGGANGFNYAYATYERIVKHG